MATIETEPKMILTGGKGEDADKPRIYPTFHLLVTDETWGFKLPEWPEGAKLIEDCGRIFNVWLIDTSTHHHICSLTPYYEATFLYSYVEKRPERLDNDDSAWEELEDKIKGYAYPENQIEYFTVFDCEKDSNPDTAQYFINPKDALHFIPYPDDTYEDLKENVIEGESGNPTYC